MLRYQSNVAYRTCNRGIMAILRHVSRCCQLARERIVLQSRKSAAISSSNAISTGNLNSSGFGFSLLAALKYQYSQHLSKCTALALVDSITHNGYLIDCSQAAFLSVSSNLPSTPQLARMVRAEPSNMSLIVRDTEVATLRCTINL